NDSRLFFCASGSRPWARHECHRFMCIYDSTRVRSIKEKNASFSLQSVRKEVVVVQCRIIKMIRFVIYLVLHPIGLECPAKTLKRNRCCSSWYREIESIKK